MSSCVALMKKEISYIAASNQGGETMRRMVESQSIGQFGMNRLSTYHLLELAVRLFKFRADRWKRRALFYRRYQEYFPRVSASRFVDRCLELEMRYRVLVEIIGTMTAQGQLMAAPGGVVRGKHGRPAALLYHPVTV